MKSNVAMMVTVCTAAAMTEVHLETKGSLKFFV
jgi:hypothetical protein